MEDLLTILHRTFLAVPSALCFSYSFMLFQHCRINHFRRTLAIIYLFWGIGYLCAFMNSCTDFAHIVFEQIWRFDVIVIGNFFIITMLFLPYDLFKPGQLSFKKIVILFLPSVVITALYGIIRFIKQQDYEIIFTYSQMSDSIGHFNVWFRFVLLAMSAGYIAYIIFRTYSNEKNYIHWIRENFSDNDNVECSWMRTYAYIILIITLFYLIILIFGGKLSIILHALVICISFSYIFYKGICTESPYPHDFEVFLINPSKQQGAVSNEGPIEKIFDEINPKSFESKIPQYFEALKKWMESEKPYLYKDFKLSDASRILPLNRSYLSRIFNEGYHMNFSEVVRQYRVEQSKEILTKNPDLPLYLVADASGFNSDSTFIKAFKQVTGTTPTQFKLSVKENKMKA